MQNDNYKKNIETRRVKSSKDQKCSLIFLLDIHWCIITFIKLTGTNRGMTSATLAAHHVALQCESIWVQLSVWLLQLSNHIYHKNVSNLWRWFLQQAKGRLLTLTLERQWFNETLSQQTPFLCPAEASNKSKTGTRECVNSIPASRSGVMNNLFTFSHSQRGLCSGFLWMALIVSTVCFAAALTNQ